MTRPIIFVVHLAPCGVVVRPCADAVLFYIVERLRDNQFEHSDRIATSPLVAFRTGLRAQRVGEITPPCAHTSVVLHVRVTLGDVHLPGTFLYRPYIHRIRLAVVTHRVRNGVAVYLVQENMHLENRVASLEGGVFAFVLAHLAFAELGLGHDLIHRVLRHQITASFVFDTLVGLLITRLARQIGHRLVLA